MLGHDESSRLTGQVAHYAALGQFDSSVPISPSPSPPDPVVTKAAP